MYLWKAVLVCQIPVTEGRPLPPNMSDYILTRYLRAGLSFLLHFM